MRAADRSSDGEQVSALEWVVAALGLVLVVGTIVLTLRDALGGSDAPPSLVVRADSVIALEGAGFLVRFTAENRGDHTAADVPITGELRLAADSTETTDATLDYVPGHSRRRGGLYFRSDPRRGTLELRAGGFQDP